MKSWILCLMVLLSLCVGASSPGVCQDSLVLDTGLDLDAAFPHVSLFTHDDWESRPDEVAMYKLLIAAQVASKRMVAHFHHYTQSHWVTKTRFSHVVGGCDNSFPVVIIQHYSGAILEVSKDGSILADVAHAGVGELSFFRRRCKDGSCSSTKTGSTEELPPVKDVVSIADAYVQNEPELKPEPGLELELTESYRFTRWERIVFPIALMLTGLFGVVVSFTIFGISHISGGKPRGKRRKR